jgi:YVTN family beta-propeller protein/autotransporter-associated beta strand protein
VYVTNFNNGTVTPVNTAANTPGTPIQVGPNPEGVAVTPNGKTVYVATVGTTGFRGAVGFVTPIDAATNTPGTPIDVGPNPRGVAMSPDGKTVYVANLIVPGEDFGTVTPINTATNTPGTPIPVGAGNQPFALAVSPDGKTVYTANTFGNSITVIDTTTTNAVRTISLGVQPFGLAVTPNGQSLYVATGSNTVTVINTGNNQIVDTISVAPGSNGVAMSPDGKTVYVTNFSNGTVTPINTATNMAGTPIPVGMMPEIFPGIASNGNALLASGLTFVARTSGALDSTLASGPTGSPGPIFTGGTLQFAGPNITTGLPIILQVEGGTFDTLANNATLTGTISGPGTLTKIGTGTLTLTADNSYSGGTTIQDGTLVAGTPSTAQEISFALGTGDVFLKGGTLRTPSLDPLTINVGGNYRQGPGGTLALGMAGINGEDYDHVQVQGNASLDGTLAVFSLNNFRPIGGNAFEVLRTGGTRAGMFSTVNDSLNNNPGLQRVDVYAPNGVALVYVQAAPTPVPPGPSPTPKPPIDVEDPKPLPPVDPEEPLELPDVLAILDPTAEQLTALYEVSFSGANTQRFKLDERFADVQRGSTGFTSNLPVPPPPSGKEAIGQGKAPPPVFQPTPQNRWGVWANGWGDWVSVDNDGATKGYNFTTGGFIIGVDYRITDYFAIGFMGSYAYTRTNLQPSGDIDVNTGRGGLYFTYFSHGFYLNGAAYGGHNSYNTSRQGILGAANGSTSGGEFSTFRPNRIRFSLWKFRGWPTFCPSIYPRACRWIQRTRFVGSIEYPI